MRAQTVFLGIIAAILTFAALHWARSVFIPIFLGIFLIAAAWPVKRAAEHIMPQWMANTVALATIALCFAIFGGLIFLAGQSIAGSAADYQQQFNDLLRQGRSIATNLGVPRDAELMSPQAVQDLAQRAANFSVATVTAVGFVGAFVLLGMPEAAGIATYFSRQAEHADAKPAFDTAKEALHRVQGYLGALTFVSILTGLLTYGVAVVVGLDFAAVFGLLTFALNYIPIIGSVIAVIIPTAFAALQFDLQGAAVIAGSLGTIQIVIANLVYPKLAGAMVSLRAPAMLAALTFWGFLWGVAGAVLAVPLTSAFAILCGHFRETRWIAVLLSGAPSLHADDHLKGHTPPEVP